MAADKTDEVKVFWAEREEKYGGKVSFQSYATLLGESGSEKLNGRGGLLFIIDERVYFEDFERQNALMALMNRKDSDYEKTEISFPVSHITGTVKVPEKWAKSCIYDGSLEERMPELKGLKAMFARGFRLIQLQDRPSLLIEIMEDEAFLSQVQS